MQMLNIKERKLLELQITQTSISDGKKCLSSTPLKSEKYLSNVYQMEGAHLQCANNHYVMFEYKGMKTVGVTDHTNQTPSKHFLVRKMSKFNTPQK